MRRQLVFFGTISVLLAAGCGLLLAAMATLISFSGGKPGQVNS